MRVRKHAITIAEVVSAMNYFTHIGLLMNTSDSL